MTFHEIKESMLTIPPPHKSHTQDEKFQKDHPSGPFRTNRQDSVTPLRLGHEGGHSY